VPRACADLGHRNHPTLLFHWDGSANAIPFVAWAVERGRTRSSTRLINSGFLAASSLDDTASSLSTSLVRKMSDACARLFLSFLSSAEHQRLGFGPPVRYRTSALPAGHAGFSPRMRGFTHPCSPPLSAQPQSLALYPTKIAAERAIGGTRAPHAWQAIALLLPLPPLCLATRPLSERQCNCSTSCASPRTRAVQGGHPEEDWVPEIRRGPWSPAYPGTWTAVLLWHEATRHQVVSGVRTVRRAAEGAKRAVVLIRGWRRSLGAHLPIIA